jgi:NADH dehydrogenase, FAD-containing subunit
MNSAEREPSEPTRILILGGGFGGVSVARELEKRLPRSANVRITLVNRENFFLFTPCCTKWPRAISTSRTS